MSRKLNMPHASYFLAAVMALMMIVFWYRGTPDTFTWPWLLLTIVNLGNTCFGETRILQSLQKAPDSPEKKEVESRIRTSTVYAIACIWFAFYLGTYVAGGVHLKGHAHIAGWLN